MIFGILGWDSFCNGQHGTSPHSMEVRVGKSTKKGPGGFWIAIFAAIFHPNLCVGGEFLWQIFSHKWRNMEEHEISHWKKHLCFSDGDDGRRGWDWMGTPLWLARCELQDGVLREFCRNLVGNPAIKLPWLGMFFLQPQHWWWLGDGLWHWVYHIIQQMDCGVGNGLLPLGWELFLLMNTELLNGNW